MRESRKCRSTTGEYELTADEKKEEHKPPRLLSILLLQGTVAIYSINTIVAKFASGHPLMSLPFLLLLALEVLVMGVYALCWQQMIKRFPLGVAYANKAMGLLWSLLFGVLLFHEGVTVKKLAALALVIAGTILINRVGEEEA